jgi:hypothetical protein
MPNISGSRLRELEACETRLQQINTQRSVEWVGKALGDTFAMKLSSTPYSEWSIADKVLLRQITSGAPMARWAYIGLLPKPVRG